MDSVQHHRQKQKHILMLPFMGQGHLIPFLALARLIHHRTGFTITIANTPLNINYLKSTISDPSEISGIRFAELSFSPSDHGLPAGAENAEVLPLSLLDKLFHASATLKPSVQSLLSDIIAENHGTPPLCVISDVFLGWAVEVAREVGSAGVTFSTGGVYGTAAYVSIWQHLPHRSSESDEFSVPGFPERCRFHISQLHPYLRAADGTDSWSRFMQTQIGLSLKSDGWLCNSVEELEPLGLQILRSYINLPVWTIGPLLPPEILRDNKTSVLSSGVSRLAKKPGVSAEKCLQWLSSHQPNSVLYISFGSQNTISPHQMMELAIGLEASGKAFIWVIRPPIGFDIRGGFRAEWLPEGFEDRAARRGQGLLVRDWAPQLEILAHESTGAFVSHCGWNSVLESLSQGVAVIGWPMAAEQAYNAKMLVEEMGVAVELTRGVESKIRGEEVRKVVEMVMVMEGEGVGAEMKRKAGELREKIRSAVKEDGSSVKAMDDFVLRLRDWRLGTKSNNKGSRDLVVLNVI